MKAAGGMLPGRLVVALVVALGAGEATAQDDVLAATWAAYQESFMEADGRVIDRGDHDRSTSEGQAYAMVRALVMDDREAFARVRGWTSANLQGLDPTRLPAWSWGRGANGAWGVSDSNPASDADQWMAWALLGAARAWDRPDYRQEALGLLARIWDEETMEIAGQRVLLPGPWAKTTDPVRLNPSYWLPFAWRAFAEADPAHAWASLIDPAYRLLEACRSANSLPPDWCHVRVADGIVVPAPRGHEADDDFGFEAFRLAWTLAAEAKWHHEIRARRLLRDFGELSDRWTLERKIPAVIAPGGRGRVDWEYGGMYGAMLPAWALVRKGTADALWSDVIVPSRAAHGWGPETDYYGQNWIWLGYALWQGKMGPDGPA